MSRDLFGTDGIRGPAGQYPLDATGAQQVGRAIGRHFAKPGQRLILGYDPRESSDQLADNVIKGLTAVGADVVSVEVVPTPGLAYLAREGDFVAGVMVTASHNPYQYNGVKVFDAHGDKLSDDTETALNTLIKTDMPAHEAGKAVVDEYLVKQYEDFLVASANDDRLDGLKIAIDSANGAASGLAERVFGRLGAQVTALFDKPDGRNINAGCGATDTGSLKSVVIDKRLDLGIAVDGDADRLALIDEQGREVNGDHLLYLLAVTGHLDGVVATVMSNLGLERALDQRGIKLERAKVGDRYVLEGLRRTGFRLGGEQSGHIIMPELLKTGDGLLAAVQTVRALAADGKSLAQWRNEVTLVPQALVNIPLADRSSLERPEVRAFIKQQIEQLGREGRLLVRPSGTEPLVRVMVEAPDAEKVAAAIAGRLKELVAA